MTRPVLAALFLLWIAGPVRAQAGTTPPSATQQDPEAAYQDLSRALNQAISDWRKAAADAVQGAQAAGGEMPAMSMTPPTKPIIDRAQALAARYAGTDDAVRFLAFVCKNGTGERAAVQQAVATLLADHAQSPAIRAVLGHLGGAYRHLGAERDVIALLDRVIDRNANSECRAEALLVRGNLRLQTAATEAQRTAALADIRRAVALGEEILARTGSILQQAKGVLFEIERLQVGCTAPDIAAQDTDGVEFKLSDHRGKVVLLDFWGFW